MRKDQIDRLKQLAEEIADQFIIDADPNTWVGHGLTQAEMTQAERGDAVWCRKVPIQTGALLARVLDINDRCVSPNGAMSPDEDTEKEIKKYEKQAKELIHAAQSSAAGKR